MTVTLMLKVSFSSAQYIYISYTFSMSRLWCVRTKTVILNFASCYRIQYKIPPGGWVSCGRREGYLGLPWLSCYSSFALPFPRARLVPQLPRSRSLPKLGGIGQWLRLAPGASLNWAVVRGWLRPLGTHWGCQLA